MAHQTSPGIRPDPEQVRLGRNFEVRYWMQVFGVSREALERAVMLVGSHAESVRRYLVGQEADRRRDPAVDSEAAAGHPEPDRRSVGAD